MVANSLSVTPLSVHIQDLEIQHRDVIDYLLQIPEDERVTAFVQLVEVGVYCLQRARSVQETEFLKRQVESLIHQMETAVGKIPVSIETQLVQQIGPEDGKVLAPIRVMVEQVSKATKERIEDVSHLLAGEIDPARQDSTLGRALQQLRDLLNPRLDGSVQKCLEVAVESVAGKEGRLAETVRLVLADSVKPLADELNRLGKIVYGSQQTQALQDQTTLKGSPFEIEIVGLLQPWARLTGAQVEHVGPDNQPGDVVIVAIAPNQTQLRLVIEAKDENDSKGRKRLNDLLSLAADHRNADAAIFVCRQPEGLAKEIGEWGEGQIQRGPWVATTRDHLITAVRHVIARKQLADMSNHRPEVNSSVITSQADRIRTALKRIQGLRSNLTSIRTAANGVETELDSLKKDITDALDQIDRSLSAEVFRGAESPVPLEMAGASIRS